MFARFRNLMRLPRDSVAGSVSARTDDGAASVGERLDRISDQLEALLVQLRVNALGPERELCFLFRDNLIKMHLPFADIDGIQKQILARRTFYEHRDLARAAAYIKPGSVIIDAGANIGNHTIFFSKVCAAREVIAVEVMRTTFAVLQRNVALNGLSNVRLLNVGLGARSGHATLDQMRVTNIGATTIKAADSTGPYDIITIDSLGCADLDFIKIDVEGSFLDVLEGGRETIGRCRPLIWIELREKHNEWEPGEGALRNMGYRLESRLSGTNFIFAPT